MINIGIVGSRLYTNKQKVEQVVHKCIEKYLEKRAKNFEETIKTLLKHNSSQLEIRDKMNKTPLDYFPGLNFLLTVE